jgi:hypothetical protein
MQFSEALEKHIFYLRTAKVEYFNEIYKEYGIKGVDVYNAFKAMLAHGETYFLGKDAAELMEIAATNYPIDVLVEAPPTLAGFCWFERPKPLVDACSMTGFQWIATSYGTYIIGYLQGITAIPVPLGFAAYEDGDTIEKATLITKAVKADEMSQNFSALTMLEAAAFFAFCNQRILRSSKEHPNRATQRRLRKHPKKDNLINVIKLRAIDYVGSSDGHRDTEWTCRWLVRGHWRRLKTNRAVWVVPYIKGPADKPLKVPEHNIMAVVR